MRALWQRAAGVSSDTTPCPWQRDGVGPATATLGRRIGCATQRVFRVVDREGRHRPNWPLLAGVASASVTSLAWRPERQDAASGRAMVATRVAIVLGSAVAKQLAVHWWADRTGR